MCSAVELLSLSSSQLPDIFQEKKKWCLYNAGFTLSQDKREREKDPTIECCPGFQGKTGASIYFFPSSPLDISIAFSNLRRVELASVSDDYWLLCCGSESL